MKSFVKKSLVLLLCSGVYYQAHATVGDEPSFFKPPHHIKPNMPTGKANGLTPAQIAKAYGFDKIANQGEGQVIGIVNAYDSPTVEADLNAFSKHFNLPACTTENGCFTKIYAAGSKPKADANWALETALDVQWVHAIAPKAKILLVEASEASLPGLMQAVAMAVHKGANVVSMSWGAKEFSQQTLFDKNFRASGVTFVAASGDSGNGSIWPAASPTVLSVGGTTLNIDENDNYLSETAWKGSGGGQSRYEREPDFQAGFPIPDAHNHRGIPDVAYNADPQTGFPVYDSFPFRGRSGWFVVGGTSAGAPQWAALIAIANSVGKRTNVDSKAIYAVGKTNYDAAYHDITAGNNGNCGYLCNAQVNYDYVTGLGSPRVDKIINLLTVS